MVYPQKEISLAISLYKFKDYLEERIKFPTVQLIFNYIQNFYPSEYSFFENQMITDFYSWLLNEPHYRSTVQTLRKEILNEVHAFYRKNLLDMEFEQLQKSLFSKVIHVHEKEDALEILNQYYQDKYKSVRTLHFELQSSIALIMKSNGDLQTLVHSPLYSIQHGRLKPLTPLSHLYYDHQMELQLLKIHRIVGDNGECYLFSIQKHYTELKKINIKNFSLIEKKHLSNLQEEPLVFLRLKKIENNYIKAKTDPFYQELVSTLQNGYQKLLIGHPEAASTAEKCIQEVRIALNNVYPDDRLLLLLTANIEYYLRKKESSKNLL